MRQTVFISKSNCMQYKPTVESALLRRRDSDSPRKSASEVHSKTLIDSTCKVCGNIFTTPADTKRYSPLCTSIAVSRAKVAGLHDTYTIRRGPFRRPRVARASAMARAPSRGGSSKIASNSPCSSNHLQSTWNKSAQCKLTCDSNPWSVALWRAFFSSASLPSTPTTSRAVAAMGNVKLPTPQNRSRTRSFGVSCIKLTARDTSVRFAVKFAWMKSVGRNPISRPNSGSE